MKKILFKSAASLLLLPRIIKVSFAFVIDACSCALAVWFAFYLRLGELISFSDEHQWAAGMLQATILSLALALPIFILTGFYKAIFRYSGWPVIIGVAKAVALYGLLYFLFVAAWGMPNIPRTIGIIQPVVLFILVASSRLAAKGGLDERFLKARERDYRSVALIYGAGQAGRRLAAALAASHEMRVIGFLDDDVRLRGRILNGTPIYGPDDLVALVAKHGVRHVLLAMSRLNRKRRNEILNSIRPLRLSVRVLPNIDDLMRARLRVEDLCELDIEDLLGRDPVEPNFTLLNKNISGKVVLVTGAGGSIGSELCRQILSLNPVKLLLVEQSEFALYAIHQELESKAIKNGISIIPLLGSVQNFDRMHAIMNAWTPFAVYHAAAYKHVPLVEHNPVEGIRNNVLGTLRTAEAAVIAGVSNFVLVSTDKAVRPTSVMGASKRLAEMLLQGLAETALSTKFSMVRFGNVLGSSGSVVPRFRRQIRDGGPVTITHSEITRYFMTIPEAAQLVIQAGAMAEGGEVFVLDMGEPVKIIDLARRMVELSGLSVKEPGNPQGDIEITITGLRPGEKLYEELLIGDDPSPTNHPRIMKARETFMSWDLMQPHVKALEEEMDRYNLGAVCMILKGLVTGYSTSSQFSDLIMWQMDN